MVVVWRAIRKQIKAIHWSSKTAPTRCGRIPELWIEMVRPKGEYQGQRLVARRGTEGMKIGG